MRSPQELQRPPLPRLLPPPPWARNPPAALWVMLPVGPQRGALHSPASRGHWGEQPLLTASQAANRPTTFSLPTFPHCWVLPLLPGKLPARSQPAAAALLPQNRKGLRCAVCTPKVNKGHVTGAARTDDVPPSNDGARRVLTTLRSAVMARGAQRALMTYSFSVRGECARALGSVPQWQF